MHTTEDPWMGSVLRPVRLRGDLQEPLAQASTRKTLNIRYTVNMVPWTPEGSFKKMSWAQLKKELLITFQSDCQWMRFTLTSPGLKITFDVGSETKFASLKEMICRHAHLFIKKNPDSEFNLNIEKTDDLSFYEKQDAKVWSQPL